MTDREESTLCWPCCGEAVGRGHAPSCPTKPIKILPMTRQEKLDAFTRENFDEDYL